MEPIHLSGSNGALKIEVRKQSGAAVGWCNCYVCTDRSYFIGAEDLRYLTARLLDWAIKPRSTGWVLSLSEVHCSVYSADRENGSELLVYDMHGLLFSRLCVPDHYKATWRDMLTHIV